MCDYSIHSLNRKAKVGDKLVSTTFNSHSRGFSEVGEPSIAVCVKPGTEIEFEGNVRYSKELKYKSFIEDVGIAFSKIFRLNRKTIKATTAIFRQASHYSNSNDSPALKDACRANGFRHRDALEFPDGQVVLLTNLVPGQKAIVLQLPAEKVEVRYPPKEIYTGESCSNTTAPELETIG